ncbi:aminoacetone oxidase family FAD-binding enzyme [Enterococcus italicus]|uniref:NAD(P)/FAD-dependent oxidoreductase n=1 Tax=Enterococcus italicus TaxID=246144 RepID=UPI003FA2CA3D
MNTKYDVIVVGGGTSGMMASIAAAEQGAKVVLIDKNKKYGKKLLMTGGGRCNVTNNREVDDLIRHIPGNGRFLYSTFSQFNNFDVMDFFESHGVSLKEEDHGRMFPVTNKSKTIVDTLVETATQLGVTLLPNTTVKSLLFDADHITGVKTEFETIQAPCVILTTGGKTYPSTGSTGDGYRFAKSVGHTITPLYATESPLLSDEAFIHSKELQGISLRDCLLQVLDNQGKLVTEHKMDLLFTHFGLSGPAALRCSSFVNQLLESQPDVTVVLDCFPERSKEELLQSITTKLHQSKKAAKNELAAFLPDRLLVFYLEQLGLADTPANQLTEAQTLSIVEKWKDFPIRVNKTLPIEKSFVTGGGVNTKEIQPKSMESKKKNGLFFAGELVDVNGYTGGFNITAAFCTGHSAGVHAAQEASYFQF